MSQNIISFLALSFFLSACRGDSGVSEIHEERDLNVEFKTMNAADFIFSAGLVIDMHELSHTQRKNWFATNITSLSFSADSNANAAPKGCQLSLQDGQGPRVISLEENAAYPVPQGQVIYCSGGKLGWALQDTSLRDKARELGVENTESENISFFRVPIPLANSLSTVTDKNQGIVVIFEGISQFAQLNGLDADSIISALVTHEIGNVRELRKDNQSTIKSMIERLRSTCLSKSTAARELMSSKMESCRSNIRANSRMAKYAADEFVIQTVGKKKYSAGLRPMELSKFYRIQPSDGRDLQDAHPDALERSIQFERNLERAGINTLTGGVMRPGETELQTQ